ncbi:MAG: hypothetical protein NZ898_11210 [Myxococcota bacterium]|nr:hypothetical protein [Myxococcota bacterium]MDW8363327.1 hypothetical protein [Myxococcales bacterium]
MSFWSEASPAVKGAIVVGALGLAYLGLGFVAGWPPFEKKCSGDPPSEDARCVDGEWVQQQRGLR